MPGRRQKFIRSSGLRHHTHPLGRDGFVGFLNVSSIGYWYIIGGGGGGFGKRAAQMPAKTPSNAETREAPKIYRYRLILRDCVGYRFQLVAAVALVS